MSRTWWLRVAQCSEATLVIPSLYWGILKLLCAPKTGTDVICNHHCALPSNAAIQVFKIVKAHDLHCLIESPDCSLLYSTICCRFPGWWNCWYNSTFVYEMNWETFIIVWLTSKSTFWFDSVKSDLNTWLCESVCYSDAEVLISTSIIIIIISETDQMKYTCVFMLTLQTVFDVSSKWKCTDLWLNMCLPW